ncbi:hypothetical protein H4R20_001915 [Coemansia guatemalensis]|uniref:Oxidoreductase AflY n=1 Tax=Coemansia guatemalensis TaxID=2761395 RepID=A0A9W8HYN2_9FUNG|nr:hypothetical protein H4R20_001915 [Coemansia guatemalensis]
MASNYTHDNADYSVIDKARMTLGHASAGLLLPGIDSTTRKEATRLCARDHLEHHVFFNSRGFHNHLNHHLLATFTMGGSAERLQTIFDINKTIERPLASFSNDVVITSDNYKDHLADELCYSAFVNFFHKRLEDAGENWKSAAFEYVFDPQIFQHVMSGLFHPFIQLGYGLEFESKAITAAALAQACVHSPSYKKLLLSDTFAEICSGTLANDSKGFSLIQIIDMIREDGLASEITYAEQPFSDANRAAAESLAIKYAKMWMVEPTQDAVDAKYRELLSVVALVYGSLTRPGHKRLLHFVLMHCLTSAYFLPILFESLTVDQQAKLLQAHCAVTLGTFAIHGSPKLYIPSEVIAVDTRHVTTLSQTDSGNPWLAVFEKAIASDDMHVAKVIRSLWRGNLLNAFASQTESVEGYDMPPPINWLYLAQITVDTIQASTFKDLDQQAQEGKRSWVHGMIGCDAFWTEYPKE